PRSLCLRSVDQRPSRASAPLYPSCPPRAQAPGAARASSMADPTIFAAFAAGLLSFVSPSVLPLVPGYLSVLTGGASMVPADERRRGAILGPAVLFCLSFTLVFVILGLFARGLGA